MEHQLPPLNALRAFEAAARHLSVKNAADELCVTPGAVSQLLKTLEQHLGVPLFRRVNRGIFLTDAGQAYLPPVRNAFRQISDATRKVAVPAETGLLTVSATPFFASAWLVPRLKSFQDAHPDIDLQLQTGHSLADFSRDGVDVAIRHGMGQYPGLASQRVLTVEMVAVAAPALVAERGKPKQPADLLHWPRVNDAERKGWRAWFEAQGVQDAGPARGPSFDDAGLLLKAVLAGQGAALLPAAMMAPEIADGRLVALSRASWLEDFAYYLVCPEAGRDRPKVSAFRDWLLETAQESRAKRSSSGSRKRASPTVAGQNTKREPMRSPAAKPASKSRHPMKLPRHRLLRQMVVRPRLFIAAGIAIAVGMLLPSAVEAHLVTRLLIAWNTGACLYVLLAAVMMTRSSQQLMRVRAKVQDEGQGVILVLVVVSAIASLAAIGGELAVVKDMHGLEKIAHVALAGLTVVSSWAFTQVMFTLHYAHDYYASTSKGLKAGIQFPDDEPPTYGDFFYFSAVIGTSGQTADVSFVSKPMRRIGSVHCILAYLFNTTVLALLINIGASLF